MRQYIVQKGDTLLRIAAKYGLAREQLITANPWAGQQPYLLPGQMMFLPTSLRRRYVIQEGDSPESIARTFHFQPETLEDMNPGMSIYTFPIGKTIVLPPSEPRHRIRLSGEYGPRDLAVDLDVLTVQYPKIECSTIGVSVMGKPLHAVKIGVGKRHLHVNASLHANEWITTPCLLRFLENYASALTEGYHFDGYEPDKWYQNYTLWLVPMANPDGVELVQEGVLPDHRYYDQLLHWNGGRDDFRRWKANIHGVDLGDQFPAHWEEEVERRGKTAPCPQDYAGAAPLCEPEAGALARHTLQISPVRAVSLHSQGQEIYWNYRGYEPQESERWAVTLGKASSYRPVKLQGSDAGYKDWFIQHFRRPGFTVEIGRGFNPLPVEDFEDLCVEVSSIMTAFMSLD
ncbi:LysM peptidoglycan-binding domain-containing protein [Paenibacillus sp. N3/727]|uniref:M14 family metallopeptidase n=1 Tax=Paenibacillus sp. N3/727 TaxID=2925845 RepID=UPI001F53665F|nr:M14 family metallopeptidase [Paenibacillus sp. N3/727]UNK17113.1 LysM peptidoglycan-binding domain-containing protein [Paenibacillus sp. N3/727]